MRLIKTAICLFTELSETAQEKALDDLWDCNTQCEWWEDTYADLRELGIRVARFNDHDATIELTGDPLDVANIILNTCGTATWIYQTALYFRNETNNASYIDSAVEVEFTKALAEDVRIMLRNEYEFLTSRKGIEETIFANEYEFTIDGDLV